MRLWPSLLFGNYVLSQLHCFQETLGGKLAHKGTYIASILARRLKIEDIISKYHRLVFIRDATKWLASLLADLTLLYETKLAVTPCCGRPWLSSTRRSLMIDEIL